MASKNIWIESPVVPAHAENLAMFDGKPADKLHVTLAFSSLKADQFGWGEALDLRTKLIEATSKVPPPATVSVNGAAILQPGKHDIAAVLVNGGDLWEYRNAVAQVLVDHYMLDGTIPGWLPHITIADGVAHSHDLGNLLARVAEMETISLERPLLRLGRLALPL